MCGCLGLVCLSAEKKANVAVVLLSPQKLQWTSHQLLTSEAGRSLVDHPSDPEIKENSLVKTSHIVERDALVCTFSVAIGVMVQQDQHQAENRTGLLPFLLAID